MRAQAQRAVMAALAGMVGLVFWGMLFWGLLAAPLGIFHQLPNATAVTEQLVAGDARTGTYFMPWPRSTPEQFAAFVAQHQAAATFEDAVTLARAPESPTLLLVSWATSG